MALKPEAAAIRAAYALIDPTTCSGRSSATAARKRAPGELIGDDALTFAINRSLAGLKL